jgi:hypothetical protein
MSLQSRPDFFGSFIWHVPDGLLRQLLRVGHCSQIGAFALACIAVGIVLAVVMSVAACLPQ